MRFDESPAGIISASTIFLFLTTATIVLRFIARRRQNQAIGVDGWLTIPAWLCFVGLVADASYGVAHQFVAYPIPASKDELQAIFPAVAKIYYILSGFSILSVGSTRLSTIFFYRRLFVLSGRETSIFSICTIIAILINAAWMVSFVFFDAFICGTDFSELLATSNSARCHNLQFLEGVTVSSLILDVLILCLPLPMIFRLHASLSRKLGIAGVFLLATAGVAASCARAVININLVNGGPTIEHEDAFLANTQLVYYVFLEAGLGLVATNLPSLWYFVSKATIPEQLVRSIRSIISLASLDSAERSKHEGGNKSNDANSSTSGIETTQEFKVEFEPSSSTTTTNHRGEA